MMLPGWPSSPLVLVVRLAPTQPTSCHPLQVAEAEGGRRGNCWPPVGCERTADRYHGAGCIADVGRQACGGVVAAVLAANVAGRGPPR